MKTTNVRQDNTGRYIKVIETEGLPKERISIRWQNKETDKEEEIASVFGAGEVQIIYAPKSRRL